MAGLRTQLRELAPSAKEPLFRRLLLEEGLAYLREKNSIIGFELDMGMEQALSGFTLIAIQKHTIYAYCSDLHEEPRLILFPPLEKLFDPAFELLHLRVIKYRFTNARFSGVFLGRGTLEDLVADLTPPQKQIDIPDMVVEQMKERMERAADPVPDAMESEGPEAGDLNQDFGEPDYERFEDGGYDGYSSGYDTGYDGYDMGYDSYGPGYGSEYTEPPDGVSVPEGEPAEDSRAQKLKARKFTSLAEVSDYCSCTLGVARPLAVNVVNKALQSSVAPEYRIELAVKLFAKLFNDKRI